MFLVLRGASIFSCPLPLPAPLLMFCRFFRPTCTVGAVAAFFVNLGTYPVIKHNFVDVVGACVNQNGQMMRQNKRRRLFCRLPVLICTVASVIIVIYVVTRVPHFTNINYVDLSQHTVSEITSTLSKR